MPRHYTQQQMLAFAGIRTCEENERWWHVGFQNEGVIYKRTEMRIVPQGIFKKRITYSPHRKGSRIQVVKIRAIQRTGTLCLLPSKSGRWSPAYASGGEL